MFWRGDIGLKDLLACIGRTRDEDLHTALMPGIDIPVEELDLLPGTSPPLYHEAMQLLLLGMNRLAADATDADAICSPVESCAAALAAWTVTARQKWSVTLIEIHSKHPVNRTNLVPPQTWLKASSITCMACSMFNVLCIFLMGVLI